MGNKKIVYVLIGFVLLAALILAAVLLSDNSDENAHEKQLEIIDDVQISEDTLGGIPVDTEADGENPEQDTHSYFAPAAGQVNNKSVLTYTDTEGRTLTVGLSNVEAKLSREGILLAPHYSTATEDNIIGYYMTSNKGYIDSSGEFADIDSLEGHTDVLLDWAYDTAAPAGYISDENYGAYWTFDSVEVSDEPVLLSLRAIDMQTYTVLSIVHVQIERIDGVYTLTKITDGDIRTTHPEDDREALVAQGTALMQDNKYYDAIQESYNTVFVECVAQSYFPRLRNINNEWVPRGRLISPLYAVTIVPKTSRHYGIATFYFAKTEIGYELIGSDYPTVLTKSRLPAE